MPMFEYECEKCHFEFEEFIPSSSKETPVCPECGAAETKKLISVSSLKTGAAPFDIFKKHDQVKMMHPAERARRGLNTKTPCSGSCGATMGNAGKSS